MKIRISDTIGNEFEFESPHSWCNWNVLPEWKGELYTWCFVADPSIVDDANKFIWKDNQDIRKFQINIIDDSGEVSDNLIPESGDPTIWFTNAGDWLYMEIRNNFEGDPMGGEEG